MFKEIQRDVNIVSYYFEADHGKDPLDGLGCNIKTMVFKKVFSHTTIIKAGKEFTEFANIVSTISCLYLPNNDILQYCTDLVYTDTYSHKNTQDCTELRFKGCAL